MSLLNGKHVVKEIEGVRCTIVEENADKSRIDFLRKLLELNGFEVRIEEVPPADESGSAGYTIGVTDMVFNPVIAVYQRLLRTEDGKRVTPDYWNQKSREIEPNYWDRSKK